MGELQESLYGLAEVGGLKCTADMLEWYMSDKDVMKTELEDVSV
jgi:hypothetical protein